MTRTRKILSTLLAVAVTLPAVLAAQAPRGGGPGTPRGGGPGDRPRPAGVTRLLNARRQLDLTPRQVAQLDSIERVVVAERRALQERIRPSRDSMAQRVRAMRGTSRDSIRDAVRARVEALRPQLEQARRRDSSSTAAAERVLTDTQRQKLSEIRAEERGRMRGMREAQMRGRMQGRPAVRERRPMPGRRPD